MTLTVGQTLWFFPGWRGKPYQITVTKLGRKWAKVKGDYGRDFEIDIETLREKPHPQGVGTQGCAYLSEQEYDKQLILNKNWWDFTSRLPKISPPPSMTYEQIETIREMCGVPPYRETIK